MMRQAVCVYGSVTVPGGATTLLCVCEDCATPDVLTLAMHWPYPLSADQRAECTRCGVMVSVASLSRRSAA